MKIFSIQENKENIFLGKNQMKKKLEYTNIINKIEKNFENSIMIDGGISHYKLSLLIIF